MSVQHAQQLIAELYDYDAPDWGTPESSYARNYLEHLTEGRTMNQSVVPSPAEKKRIRERVERELAR